MSRRPSPNKLVRGCASAGLAACAATWRGHGDTTTALAVAAGVAAIVTGAGPAGGGGRGEGAGVRAGTHHALGPRTLSGWPENGHTKPLIVLSLATRKIKIIFKNVRQSLLPVFRRRRKKESNRQKVYRMLFFLFVFLIGQYKPKCKCSQQRPLIWQWLCLNLAMEKW